MSWGNGSSRTSSAAHKRWVRAVLANARGVCQIREPGCTGAPVLADHIVPVAEGGAPFDIANGQGACRACHDKKTQREAARGRQRYYGAAKRPPEQHPGLLP